MLVGGDQISDAAPAGIHNQAKTLEAYCKQRDDAEVQGRLAEIKLRARIRIGELVRELAKHQGKRKVVVQFESHAPCGSNGSA